MKRLLFIALIVLMSVQTKENKMRNEDRGRTAGRTTVSAPAWGETNRGRSAGVTAPATTTTNTSLGNALGASGSGTAGRRNSSYEDNFSLTPSGLGGGNAVVPNFNTPSSITNGQAAPRPAWATNVTNNLPAWARPGQAAPSTGAPALPAWMNNLNQPNSGPSQPASRWNPRGYQPGEEPTMPTAPTAAQPPRSSGGSIFDNYAAPGIAAANASGVMDSYNYGQLQSANGAGGYFDRWKAFQPSNSGGGYSKYWRGGGGGGFGTKYGGWDDNYDYQPKQYTQTPYMPDMGLFQLNWKG